MTDYPNINAVWAGLAIDALARNGVTAFFVSPGSRSAPLAAAIAQHAGVTAHVHFDERAAAFAALGYGTAAGRPAALLCTSGTAAANYLPALVEASMGHVPLIVLTADRPPELLKTGANQTIEQRNLYGGYVRWSAELPCPTVDIPPAMVLTTIDQAVHRSMSAPPGPVHINCMFREPLAPVPEGGPFSGYLDSAAHRDSGPYTRYLPAAVDVAPNTIGPVLDQLNSTDAGLIAAGRLRGAGESAAVRALADALGWPVFADVTSGLRLGAPEPPVIGNFNQLLVLEGVRERLRPDVVLHIGGPITSKRFLNFIADAAPTAYIHAAPHPERHDPLHMASHRIPAPAQALARSLGPQVTRNDPARLSWMFELNTRVHEALDDYLAAGGGLTEPAVARRVSMLAPGNGALFLGNSMPIRDMDLFASPKSRPIAVYANRGASGIDGNIASAAGIALATGKPVTALIGDLAALHDLNALALARHIATPLVIVVINNDGGGVFSMLPIADYPEVFERFFGTPHGLGFRPAAEMFGARYAAPEDMEAFTEAYQSAIEHPGPSLIEARTDRSENAASHRDIDAAMAHILEDAAE